MPSIFDSFRRKNGAVVGDSNERLQKNEATINEGLLPNGSGKRNTGTSSNPLERDRQSILKFLRRDRIQVSVDEQVSWRPTTLRAPVLSCFVIVSLAVVGILEYLSYRSSHTGNGRGLAFAASTDDLSRGVTFLYLLLPTIISVCYSMLWSWVDLDAMRLEPWFQLSKPEGASAEDSLLLQYPADFLGFVPIIAARRKHWAVFYTGGIMMMIIWAITPLQSAIFTTGPVTRKRGSTMRTSASLPAIELQDARLNASFQNTAYGISWLDENFPAYTTKNYALSPYAPVDLSADSLPSETWSSTTEMFSTSLSCTPAEITLQSDTDYTFTSEAGCVVSEIGLLAEDTADYVLYYIQYWDNAYDDWALESPTCGLEFQHNFLAIWANIASQNSSYSNDFSNITAVFCEPSYQIQTVYAQVNASNQAVVENEHYETIGSPKNLTDDVFNITKFEYQIGTGVSSTIQGTGDWPDIAIIEQYPRLNTYGLSWPLTSMVGFAVANMNYTMDELVDPVALQQAFQGAHRILFTSAFSALLDPSDSNKVDLRNGTRLDHPDAIIFVRTFSIIVEISLCVVSALTFLLWLTTYKRPSNMTRNPASIMDFMSIVSGSRNLLSEFADDGHTTEEALAKKLSHRRFRLVQVEEHGHHRMHLEALSGEDVVASEIASQSSGQDKNQHFQPIRPKELRLLSGVAFSLYMLGGLSILVYLFWKAGQQNGLTRPSNNSLVLSILENLVPTIFTTLLEPFWVLLNRLLCLLRPFDELRVGNSKSDITLEVKYTSLPPQLVLWRALRARHFILAAVCAIAISTNVLSVALSGLFNESTVVVSVPVNSTYTFIPQINTSSSLYTTNAVIDYSDHFYVAFSNATANTSLPAWIDKEFFYIPYNLTSLPHDLMENDHSETTIKEYQAMTKGFGVVANCTAFSADDSFSIGNASTDASISINHTLPDGRFLECTEDIGGTAGMINYTASLEIMQTLGSYDVADATKDPTGLCKVLVTAGWARLGPQVPLGSVGYENSTAGRFFDYSMMWCVPTLVAADFNVTVDSSERIIASNRTSAFDDNIDNFLAVNGSSSELYQEISALIAPTTVSTTVWHNDSFTPDWVNALIKASFNNNITFLDPFSPVPSLDIMTPKFEAIYQELSALLLGLHRTTGLFLLDNITTVVPLTIKVTQTRIFLSDSMFKITIILLALHSLIAIIYYVRRPRRFLPRMPATIASIIAYVSASRALDDVKVSNKMGYTQHTYSYGRFVGVDGKTHVGIERHELVVPLEVKNPNVKRRIGWWKKDPRSVETWI